MHLENCFKKVVLFFLLECIADRVLTVVTLSYVSMGSSRCVM